MDSAELLEIAEHDGVELLAAARLDWARPVPHCPGWDAADLVRHMGDILTWMARIVTTGEYIRRRSLERPPDNVTELPAWYHGHLDETVTVLRGAAPESETWTFSTRGDNRVQWWQRRLAVEISLHRWDAQRATGPDSGRPPAPLDGDVGGLGIEEFMTEFLPGLLAGADGDDAAGWDRLSGTLHLHATDGPAEWWVDLDARGGAVPEHRKGDTALRGTRSDLLLWLSNRDPAQPLEVIGDGAVVDRWAQLKR
jgi:uncharacterized protein (TIGR03083 family)